MRDRLLALAVESEQFAKVIAIEIPPWTDAAEANNMKAD
jgi:hypothetical protein